MENIFLNFLHVSEYPRTEKLTASTQNCIESNVITYRINIERVIFNLDKAIFPQNVTKSTQNSFEISTKLVQFSFLILRSCEQTPYMADNGLILLITPVQVILENLPRGFHGSRGDSRLKSTGN